MAKGGAFGLVMAGLLGCGPQVAVPSRDTETDDTTGTSTMSVPATTVSPDTTRGEDEVDVDDGEDDVIVDDFPSVDVGGGMCMGDCSARLDLLVVVDNSAGMGEKQLALAGALARLVDDLRTFTDANGDPSTFDVQVMVTTTDVGNPQCTPFRPRGYEPAMGAPVFEGCNARIGDFTGLSAPAVTIPEACTNVCPADVVPADPFVAFTGTKLDNVPDVAPLDVDGDGTDDSAVAQTIACLVPQGINGCGFESPLEAMLQALNPDAEWNVGPRPFLREDATLGIVLLTDEADCSFSDYAGLTDPQWQEINPDTGQTSATSAICWNAGVECDGPDAQGVYSSCASVDGPLHPISRYTNYLRDHLVDAMGKDVFMLALAGVPPVTEYNANAPFQPVAGGEFDLIVRDWIDGEYPMGDILPAEWAEGVDAARKTFLYGIGPGCTGEAIAGEFAGQALPSHRVMDVCHALDLDDATRCAVGSICDDSYDGALAFVQGIFTLRRRSGLPPKG